MTHLNTCLSEASIYRAAFLILLYEGVCLQTLYTFHCTCLARAGEFSKLDTGMMILSYSTYQFKSLKDCLLGILARHVQEIILHSLKFVNMSHW